MFSARVVTNVGDSLYLAATLWSVHDLSGSPFYTGIGGFLLYSPEVFQFLTGPLVDRWDLRWTLTGTQLVQAIAVLTIPLAAWTNSLDIFVVLTVIPTLALIDQFVYPAQSAALPRIVTEENLVQANSLFSLAYKRVDLVFKAVGGVLIAMFGAVTLYVFDAVTFLLAAVLFGSVAIPSGGPDSDRSEDRLSEYLDDLRSGVGYVRRTVLTNIIVGAAVANFVVGGTMAVLPGLADLWGGPQMYGLLVSALAAGTLLGALGASFLHEVRLGYALSVCFAIAAVAFFAAMRVPRPFASVGLFGLAWIPVGAYNVLMQTLRQTAVPDDLLGRVTAVSTSASAVAAPVGSFVAGSAASVVGLETALTVGSLGFAGVAVLFSVRRRLRVLPPIGDVSTADIKH
ncbi:MFS transporter [Halorussus salilacus]|nr:MFS transporter [Halorussus salilacus]